MCDLERMETDPKKELNLTWDDVDLLAAQTANAIHDWCKVHRPLGVRVFPVPRGGVYAAQAVRCCLVDYSMTFVERHEDADIVIDDLVDSGATRDKFDKPFFVLIDKARVSSGRYLVFPWERMSKEEGPTDNVRRLIQYIGEDQTREGLIETPMRVVKSYAHLFSGYKKNPADVMKVFEDGGEDYDQMVLLKDIEFYSCCEHHMQPFFGKAHIAYIPDKKVIGISKLARLLEVFSRRLQIQERLTTQVADALMEHLEPKGAAVVLEAQHFCMVARGVEKQNSIMTTSALRGAFMTDATVRSEFMAMIR